MYMNKKNLLVSFALIFSSVCYSQSNFDIAKKFMDKKGIELVNNEVSTRSSEQPYHIFDAVDGKGYAVVENGTVIAYSTEEPSSKFSVRPATREFKLTPKTPIEPFIEAKFNQFAEPYRDSLPLLTVGYAMYVLPPVGCGALALAKVLYHYKNEGCEALEEQYVGDDYPTLEALPATKFNWDNILPQYEEGEYTKEQAVEVAKLMKYCGYAIGTMYEFTRSGSWIKPKALLKFGFSEESYMTAENELEIGTSEWWNVLDNYLMTDLELEALLDRELEQGRPVILSGFNPDVTDGHYMVIDGRDDTGRYHIDDSGYMILSQELFMKDEVNFEEVLWWLNKVTCTVPIMPDKTTNINSTKIIKNDNFVYNLQGQKVKSYGKGIYIKNGKKYAIK